MSCEHTRAVLQGASPPVDVTEHLSSCPDCRALAQSLQDVDIPFAALPPPPVPAELLDAVRAELRAEIALEDALQALTPPPVPPALRARTAAAMAAEAIGRVIPLWRRRRGCCCISFRRHCRSHCHRRRRWYTCWSFSHSPS